MKKRNKFRKIYKGIKIPNWALCYLVNSDASGLTEEDRKIADEWVEKMRDGGRIDICNSKEGADPYFCSHPAFGLASDVEECDVIVDNSPHYSHCSYPCCGQSRFEPYKREALDGKMWWCVYDNKLHGWVAGSRFKTRKACVMSLFLDFKNERKEYEPDNDRRTLAWLKTQTEIPE